MPDFVMVAKTEDVPEGSAARFTLERREIALFNIAGAFYAIDNSCPHQGGPLAEGFIEGTTVTCPWHAWCFDVTSGEMTLGGLALIDTFEVQVRDGAVYVNPEPRA